MPGKLDTILIKLNEINKEATTAKSKLDALPVSQANLPPISATEAAERGRSLEKQLLAYTPANKAEDALAITGFASLKSELDITILALRRFTESLAISRATGQRFRDPNIPDEMANLVKYKNTLEYTTLINNLAQEAGMKHPYGISNAPGSYGSYYFQNPTEPKDITKTALNPSMFSENDISSTIYHELAHRQDDLLRQKYIIDKSVAEKSGSYLNTPVNQYRIDPKLPSGYEALPVFKDPLQGILQTVKDFSTQARIGIARELEDVYGYRPDQAQAFAASPKMSSPEELLARNVDKYIRGEPLDVNNKEFRAAIEAFYNMFDESARKFVELVKKYTPEFKAVMEQMNRETSNAINEEKLVYTGAVPTTIEGLTAAKAVFSPNPAAYKQPPEYDDLNRRLRELLQQGARGNVGGADIEGAAKSLVEGRELTRQMRLGGGSYLTRDKEINDEIKKVVEQIRELKNNYQQAAQSAERIDTANESVINDVNSLDDEWARTREEIPPEVQRGARIKALKGEESLTGLRQFRGLSDVGQEKLKELLGTTEKENESLEKLDKTILYTTDHAKSGWTEVTRSVIDNTGEVTKLASAYVKFNQVADPKQYKMAITPNAGLLTERFPFLQETIGIENFNELNRVLTVTKDDFGMLAAELDTETNSARKLNDEWTEFSRTSTLVNGQTEKTYAYVNKTGEVFTREAFEVRKAKEELERYSAEQKKLLSQKPNYPSIEKYFSKRGLPLGGETPEGFPVKTTITELPQKYGGIVTKVEASAVDKEANAIKRMAIYTNEAGDVMTATNRRVQSFTESIIHNTQEIFRWSIGVGLLYGGMYRLQQAFQQTIQNETLLADITVTLGMAQRDVNKIFEDASKVAKETGENITDVLQTYKMAYTAVGGIVDPIERTASANQLLADATILNKLSSLDAAEAIDTLSGALRQAKSSEETTAQSFSHGTKMLDQWVRLSNKANVDLGTLATAFSVTAESALNTGMTIEELNAVIATLSEKIGGLGGKETGNAVRALIGGVYQDQAAKALQSYGIAVTNTTGQMRNFMDISRDIYKLYSQKLISEDEITKLAYVLGGGVRRGQQYLAFLTDYERIQENVAVQTDATGASQIALSRKMETTQTAITQLNNSFMSLTQTLGTTGGVLDIFSSLLKIVEGLSNGFNSLSKLLGSLTIPATLLAVIQAYQALGGEPAKYRINKLPDTLGRGAGGLVSSLLTGISGVGQRAGGVGIPQKEISNIGATVGMYVSRYALGTIIGSLPALARFGEGTTAGKIGGAADIGGALVGSIVGSLAGPAGSMIGGFIGGAIADIFVAKVLSHKTDFQTLFVFERPPAEVAEKKPEVTNAEEATLQLLYGNKGIQRYLGILTNQIEYAILSKKAVPYTTPEGRQITQEEFKKYYTPDTLQAMTLKAERPERYKQLQESYLGVPVTPQALPKEEYTFFKQQEEAFREFGDEFAAITATTRDELRKELITKQIKPAEYRTTLEETYKAPVGAERTIAVINAELTKQIGINEKLKVSVYDVLDAYMRGGTDAVNYIVQLTTEIETYMNELDKIKNQPAQLFTPIPEFGTKELTGKEYEVKLNLKIAEDKEQLLAALSSITQEMEESEAARIELKLIPRVDATEKIKTISELNLVMAKAKQLQEMDLNAQIRLTADMENPFTSDDKEKLKAQAKPFAVDLGTALGQYLAEGLISQEYFSRAIDALMKQGQLALSQLSYEFSDYTSEQLMSAANSPQYYAIRNAILGAGGQSEELQKLMLPKGDPTNPLLMKKDWAIVQYLLSQILKTEEKQLEGVYNLPGGASFYVPFDAYKMGYANKGEGGGLDIPTVQENTTSTAENTRATNALTQALGSLDMTFNPSLTLEQAMQYLKDLVMPAGPTMQEIAGTSNFTWNPKMTWGEREKYLAQQQAEQQKWLPTYGPGLPTPTGPTPATTFIGPQNATYPPNLRAPIHEQPEAATDTSLLGRLRAAIESLTDFFAGIFGTVQPTAGAPTTPTNPAAQMGGGGIFAILQSIYNVLSEGALNPVEPTVAEVRRQDLLAPPAYGGTALEGDVIESTLISINSGVQSMVDLLRTAQAKQNQPRLLSEKEMGKGGGLPQVNVTVTPQPIKVDFNTTTVLTVDGAVLAAVIMPYVYSALLRYNGSQGGATRSYTSV